MSHPYGHIERMAKHGRQWLYAITYRNDGEDDGWRDTVHMYGYDEEHARDRFYDEPDSDGWRIVKVSLAVDRGHR